MGDSILDQEPLFLIKYRIESSPQDPSASETKQANVLSEEITSHNVLTLEQQFINATNRNYYPRPNRYKYRYSI